ncbi:MAG: S9 family peptidase, partial [Gammaproteobacteria bacterium]|nr:S9 family peptidase [Gammaproteobacteria bacterium]
VERTAVERSVLALLDGEGSRLLLEEHDPDGASRYLLREGPDGPLRDISVTRRPDLAALGLRRARLRYTRADGIPLSASVYLPATHADGETLPLILWVYPRTFGDRASAVASLRTASDTTGVVRAMPLFLALCGYAVMDEVSMPIIESSSEDFAAQLVASAAAAIDEAVDAGLADRRRVGVAGHSFGAFSTVMLLTHSDLFAAGAALSGAYNRTLTPFGFQTERRTLWEAPEHYLAMSPYLQADRIDAPLLLVHGERDDNAGTAPIQSRLLFEAVRRGGGTARLVMLPFEGHVYRARESVLHTAAEMLDWFDRHLKPIASPLPMAAVRASSG